VNLVCQRHLFEIPAGIAYLNCANMSPQLRSVRAAGMAAVARKAAPWTLAPADWFSGAERLRALFAEIVNANPDAIAVVPSVSYGIATAAANVVVRRGQAIVLMDREFPSNVYAWRKLAEQRQANVRTVRREPGETWTQAVIDAIGDEAAVVAVPNCHWTDGTLVDLARVGSAARAAGAALVVDASQSVGAYPLDVAEIQPDFLVTVGYKWLLGPYGLGYLYVAPRWQESGVPLEQSWLTRAGSEHFARLTEYADAYRAGARRFDMGEFPQFVLNPMAVAALEQVLAWGVECIQGTLSLLTAQAAVGLGELGGRTEPADHRVDHMIGLRPAGGTSRALLDALEEARVYVSIRGDAIRVAPHLYNDASDISRLVDVLRRAGSRARGPRQG